jgi:hypothetical protein
VMTGWASAEPAIAQTMAAALRGRNRFIDLILRSRGAEMGLWETLGNTA